MFIGQRVEASAHHLRRVRPSLRRAIGIACAALLASSLAVPSPVPPVQRAGAGTSAPANSIAYDRYSLKLDGKRVYIWAGEFQYWRLPSPSLWRDVLQKMKAAGFNAVTIYFDWGYHSPKSGVYDFSGVRNVDKLLDIAQQVGIYVIARPGPYINAETDSGGFPGWLTTLKGMARGDDPEYTADYMQWLTHIDAILARHQWTNGTGPIIAYQIENEFYDDSPPARRYMQDIERKARADGITVPFTGNHNGTYISGAGAVQLPGWDDYPQGFDCTHPNRWSPLRDYTADKQMLHDSPLYFPEFQGGAFDPWGGPGYAACAKLTGPDFERVFYEANIAAGSTMQSFYMTFGGTSWGWLAFPGVYTSYDYGAAINESRQLTPKYYQQKSLGYFVGSVTPLTKTIRLTVRRPTDVALQLDGRINPDDAGQIYVLRHADSIAATTVTTHVWLDLGCAIHAGRNTCPDGVPQTPDAYVRVPVKPDTSITINGRDSKLLLANFDFGQQHLVYSTSQFLTDATWPNRDVAVFYDQDGNDGETVLRYAGKPQVEVLAGAATSTWDAKTHELRLDYVHGPETTRVAVRAGGHTLLLLLMDRQHAEQVWKFDGKSEPVLALGPYLVRTADDASAGAIASLTGDTSEPTQLEVFAAAGTREVTWNGAIVRVTTMADGSLVGELPGPKPVTLSTLGPWRFEAGAPEIKPGFDDSRWQAADRRSSNNVARNHELPVLFADDYGFHHGDVWYRGHFNGNARPKGIILTTGTGAHGVFTAWLNGHYLGSAAEGSHYFQIDPREFAPGKPNVLSILVADMGHNEDWSHNGEYKDPRGLLAANWVGGGSPITWRIQGDRGGETPADPVRGPYNNGGLYGERHGWYLPGFNAARWATTTLPSRIDQPGVDWYRTTFKLDLPADQDVPIVLRIEDNPDRHYRALIFINGWQFGRYVNALGPQHEFVLPPGILNPDGENTIAIASWSTRHSGGLGKVSIVAVGNYSTPLRVRIVNSPKCNAYDWCKK